MKSLEQWWEERGLNLESLTSVEGETPVETPESEETVDEEKKRTAAKVPLYPPAYHDAQYPDLYKTPSAADYPVYKSMKKKD